MSSPATLGEYAATHHESLLNAALHVLVIPLDLTVAAESLPSGVQFYGGDRLTAHEHRALSEVFAHSRFTVDGGHDKHGIAGGYDIGFGVARPLVTRVDVDVDGAQLRFGRSAATVQDCLDRHEDVDADFLWHLRPSAAVTLWAVGTRGVLTIERVVPKNDDFLEPYGSDWYGVATDVTAAIPRLLAHYPGGDPSLSEIFGEVVATQLAGPHAPTPLTKLLCRAAESIRGRQLHEGLFVVVAPEVTQEVVAFVTTRMPDPDVITRFERSEFQQATGVTGSWNALDLVDEPAEKGATSVVRDDARAVVVNLESLSVWHDYAGIGGGSLLLATIPYVVHRATIANMNAAAAQLVRAFATDKPIRPGLVNLVNRSRAEVLDVKLQRRRVSLEKFTDWTCPGQLVTRLSDIRRDKDERLLADAEEAMKFVEVSAVEADRRAMEEREATERQIASVVKIGTPVIALASLVGVCAALTTIPSTNGTGSLLTLGGSALLVLALCCVGLLAGWGWYRVNGSGAHERRPFTGGARRSQTPPLQGFLAPRRDEATASDSPRRWEQSKR